MTERTNEQEVNFRAALSHIHDWYCNSKTVVLMQSHSPEDFSEEFAEEFAVQINLKKLKRRAAVFQMLSDIGIKCKSGSTVVEEVVPESAGATAGIRPGFHLSTVDPCRWFNDELAAVTRSKDGCSYSCGRSFGRHGRQCSPQEVCNSCGRLQGILKKTGALEVGERVRHNGRLAVIKEVYKHSGDCIVRYVDNGDKKSGLIKKKTKQRASSIDANELERLTLQPYDARARAACRSHRIIQPQDVKDALKKFRRSTKCLVSFRRSSYAERGWCEFERRLSQMITPAPNVLNLGTLSQMMDALGCAGDLDAFVTKYGLPKRRGPGAWKEFIETKHRFGKHDVDLLVSRHEPPMLPHNFDKLLETLVFSSLADKALLSRKYRQTFDNIFASSVHELDFSGLGWSFPIAGLSAFAGMSAFGLRVLKLENNDLSGLLDEGVALLIALEVLDVSNNRRLEGKLEALRNCTALRELCCDHCEMLTGTLDQLKNCSKLTSISLRSCTGLNGTVHALGNCGALRSLNLNGCGQITGTLDGLGACTMLTILKVAGTRLAGTLDALGHCTALTEVRVSNCSQLTGTLDALGKCQGIKRIDIYGCGRLTGDLDALANCTLLESLNCTKCIRLAGTFDALTSCTALEVIECRSCLFTGTLDGLSNCTALTTVDLRKCFELSGTLEAFSACAEMQTMNLSGCKRLTGGFNALGNCSKLKKFNCNQCEMLKGTIDSLEMCCALEHFSARDCIRLEGTLNSFGKCTALVTVDCKGCFFTGTLDAFGNCTKLTTLNFQFCSNLTGTTVALESCTVLEDLDLYGCWGIAGHR
jgi:hypothetical protein